MYLAYRHDPKMEQGVTDRLHCKFTDIKKTTKAPRIALREFLSISGEAFIKTLCLP